MVVNVFQNGFPRNKIIRNLISVYNMSRILGQVFGKLRELHEIIYKNQNFLNVETKKYSRDIPVGKAWRNVFRCSLSIFFPVAK